MQLASSEYLVPPIFRQQLNGAQSKRRQGLITRREPKDML